MSSILFYSPFDQRSRDTESLMMAFRNQGHRVISLSQAGGAGIHPFLETQGIETVSHVLPNRPGALYYLRHIWYFIRFCRHHRVDVVYSHLESANLVAAVGQYFIKANVFLCRHHVDEAALYRFNRTLAYRLTYTLARKIIVVSQRAARFMIEQEKVPSRKIIHINLAYDFSLYPKPDPEQIRSIRDQNPAKLLLLTACRLTQFKRPDLSVRTLKLLLDHDIDARLIILGRGELEESVKQAVIDHGLAGRVRFAGYVSNVMDYLAACDYLLHPSVLESSCVIVKEAALARLPVIVCKGIGDFDDYVHDRVSGFVTDQDKFAETAAGLIRQSYGNITMRKMVTERLLDEILNRFSIQRVIQQYEILNQRD